MTGLREALFRRIAQLLEPYAEDVDAVPSLAESWADAVLRVLAEHGDTQQVRDELVSSGALILDRGDRLNAVMAVVTPIVAARDAAVERAQRAEAHVCDRAERAEADLASMRRQRDKVAADAAKCLDDLTAVRQQLDQQRDASRELISRLTVAQQQLDTAVERANGRINGLEVNDWFQIAIAKEQALERAVADLAAAQQQLEQVRALASEGAFLTPEELLALLDAPAHPARHDESGQ